MGEEEKRGLQLAAYVAEFVGTFMLVFTVGCNVLAGDPTWATTSIACVLMVCIYAYAGVSGANFNPAVSFALALVDEQSMSHLPFYVIVQLLAGLTAGFAYPLMLGQDFALGPAKGYDWWHAMIAEAIYTFVLCFVVLNVARHQKGNEFYGLAIGFVIIAGGESTGHISGACFNPAVAAGVAVGAGAQKGLYWWGVYTVAELVGAALAAFCYRALRDDHEDHTVAAAVRPAHTRDELVCKRAKEKENSLGVKCGAEFLGTLVLVLTVSLNALGGFPAAVLSIASSLMCMIYALGDVSGAHFNPAVTLAIKAAGNTNISIQDCLAYILAQLGGGFCGSLLSALLEGGKVFTLQPGAEYGWKPAIAAEFIFTALLCSVVLTVATTKTHSEHMHGLAIGSCVTVGGCAIGAVSGGSLNPAVTTSAFLARAMFGPQIGATLSVWAAYSSIELAAGLFAAGLFRITHPNERHEA